MSKLERLNANVLPFAINSPEGNRYAFGTTTSSNDINVNYNENIKKGFGTGANEFPELEDFNALMYADTYLTSYLYQAGIPEWNHKQEYYINSVVMGSNGFIYKSLIGTEEIPNVNSNPTRAGNTDWKSILNDSDYALVNGDETKKFKVSDAQAENEAVNKKQIDELETRLNNSVETINDSIGTLNNSVETINDSIGTLNDSVETINDSIETINDSIETINVSIGTLNDSVSKNSTTAVTVTGTKVVGAGYMGEFGNGLWRIFQQDGTFVVPTGVTSVRVRVVGAGGGGSGGGSKGGGAGGGYAHGIFNVIAGDSYTVTVGTGGSGVPATAGGTSSFGLLISATGGTAGINFNTPAIGGLGIGGDFQSKGGAGGTSYTSGGGGAGSQLGDGGIGGNSNGGGGGAGGGAGNMGGGGSAFSNATTTLPAPDITGTIISGSISNGAVNTINATIRFPFDSFTGGGGKSSGSTGGDGGIGAGGGYSSGSGGIGGVAGGGAGGGAKPGIGGIGGGGGSTGSGISGREGAGGSGLVVVEW